MKMFLKLICGKARMLSKNRKSVQFATILWIVFFLALGLLLFFAVGKGGSFLNQTWMALKQKIFPYG